jgi:hypothetical protein
MAKVIKSMEEFQQTYFPMAAMAEKAATMPKKEFWAWFLDLPAKDREALKKAMYRLADNYTKKQTHILSLLGH